MHTSGLIHKFFAEKCPDPAYPQNILTQNNPGIRYINSSTLMHTATVEYNELLVSNEPSITRKMASILRELASPSLNLCINYQSQYEEMQTSIEILSP